jgi:hypothetical protein
LSLGVFVVLCVFFVSGATGISSVFGVSCVPAESSVSGAGWLKGRFGWLKGRVCCPLGLE